MVSTHRLQAKSTTPAEGLSDKALDLAREKRRRHQTRTRKVVFGVVSLITSVLIIGLDNLLHQRMTNNIPGLGPGYTNLIYGAY